MAISNYNINNYKKTSQTEINELMLREILKTLYYRNKQLYIQLKKKYCILEQQEFSDKDILEN